MRRFLVALAIVGIAVWRFLKPRPLQDTPLPRPSADFASGAERVAGLCAADTNRVNPICRTAFLSHGHTTPRAYGLLHGFTNCPAQYETLARELHARGYNVVAPRFPHHGYGDTLSTEFAALTSEEIVATTAEVCDALRGLGEETVLVGFSMGGAAAAWAAQNRADIDHAILVSPALSLKGVPIRWRGRFATLLTMLPNRFVWWDPVARDARVGPSHAYPRYATKAIGHLLRLGELVEAAARREVYVCGKVTVITNPQDDTVDNEGAARVVRQWRRHGAAVTTWAFPIYPPLMHDFMDPLRPDQQTDLAYPALLAWIDPPPAN